MCFYAIHTTTNDSYVSLIPVYAVYGLYSRSHMCTLSMVLILFGCLTRFRYPLAVFLPRRSMPFAFFCLFAGVVLTVDAAIPPKSSVIQPRFSSRRLDSGRQKKTSHRQKGGECKMSHSKNSIGSDGGKKIAASIQTILKDWVAYAKEKSISYSLSHGAYLNRCTILNYL